MAVKTYLPIGSVVLLKESKKRLMIYGRKQLLKTEDKEYDYIGCLYPEGFLGNGEVFLFNHEDIQLVYFIGFQDLEELHIRSLLREKQEGLQETAKEQTEPTQE